MQNKIGHVTHLFVKTQHRSVMQPADTLKLFPKRGIEGDISFGRSHRQVLLANLDVFSSYGISPGDLRENIVISGLNIDNLKSGQLIKIGDVVLESEGECTPCDRLDEIRPGLKEEIRGHRGLLARVVHGGLIHVNDPVSTSSSLSD